MEELDRRQDSEGDTHPKGESGRADEEDPEVDAQTGEVEGSEGVLGETPARECLLQHRLGQPAAKG